MADERKKKPADAEDERLSIPLDAEEALRVLMQVNPEADPAATPEHPGPRGPRRATG